MASSYLENLTKQIKAQINVVRNQMMCWLLEIMAITDHNDNIQLNLDISLSCLIPSQTIQIMINRS